MSQEQELGLWRAFANRVTLSFPFQVDILVEPGTDDRVSIGVNLHVLDRDTREPITVRTRRHGVWTNEGDAVEMLVDLLQTALKHEIHESLRLDGLLAKDQHQR